MQRLFRNTLKYTKFILKKERKNIIICCIAFFIITLAQAYSYADLYSTVDERMLIAKSMENPVMIAMMGPVYGNNNYTVGALMSNQTLVFTAIAMAIISILLVNRNTRGDEETGRMEGVLSLPMGRVANILAIIITVIIVNFLFAIFIGVGLYALGIETMGLNGSMAFGAVMGAAGMIFASITALCAQIFSTTRGTLGASFGLLGIAYLVRAIGDVSNETLALCSPLGWLLRTEVYVNNHWQYVFFTIIISLVIFGLSVYLYSIRDMGRGFIAEKKGKDSASIFLDNLFDLAVRLLRSNIIIWGIFIFVLGISYGSLLGDVEKFFESTKILKEMFSLQGGKTYYEQFISVLMPITALITTVPTLLIVTKLKSEEKSHRIEILITRPIARIKLLGSFNVLAIIASITFQVFFAIGFWYSGVTVVENAVSFRNIVIASISYLPAIWFMLGIANFFIGIFPKGSVLIWIYYAYSALVIVLGKILQLPDWMQKLSQYEAIPKFPIEKMTFDNIILITVLTVIFLAIGLWGYKNRDLENI